MIVVTPQQTCVRQGWAPPCGQARQRPPTTQLLLLHAACASGVRPGTRPEVSAPNRRRAPARRNRDFFIISPWIGVARSGTPPLRVWHGKSLETIENLLRQGRARAPSRRRARCSLLPANRARARARGRRGLRTD